MDSLSHKILVYGSKRLPTTCKLIVFSSFKLNSSAWQWLNNRYDINFKLSCTHLLNNFLHNLLAFHTFVLHGANKVVVLRLRCCPSLAPWQLFTQIPNSISFFHFNLLHPFLPSSQVCPSTLPFHQVTLVFSTHHFHAPLQFCF